MSGCEPQNGVNFVLKSHEKSRRMDSAPVNQGRNHKGREPAIRRRFDGWQPGLKCILRACERIAPDPYLRGPRRVAAGLHARNREVARGRDTHEDRNRKNTEAGNTEPVCHASHHSEPSCLERHSDAGATDASGAAGQGYAHGRR